MIKLIKSTFYHEKETKEALIEFIRNTSQLSMGRECITFEQKFAFWQGKKYCVMFNSGSSANLALIQSLHNLSILNKTDVVGFSAITWATNVMPIIQNGLVPYPIDIEISSLNVSPRTLLDTLKHTKLKALFLTNLLGFSDDIATIKKICDERKILLLEDNCESLGSEYNNIKLGNFGFASTFSFFVGHHMSTIEGGAVCTNDEKLYNELLMVRSHGWDRHLSQEVQSKTRKKHKVDNFYSKYTFYDLAYNIRPTEINGFLGKNQLKYLDETIDRREKNFKKLSSIYNNPLFERIDTQMSKYSNFAFPIICKNTKIKENYINKCNKNRIEIRPIVSGIMTKQPFYTKYIPNQGTELPNAQYVHNNGLYFGNNPDLTSKEISLILKTFL